MCGKFQPIWRQKLEKGFHGREKVVCGISFCQNFDNSTFILISTNKCNS